MVKNLVAVFGVVLGVGLACGSERVSAKDRPGRAGSAAPAVAVDKAVDYLDARAASWFDNRSCALSCHTTHPYMMVSGGGELRDRIAATVRERVRDWPELSWWYDATPDKVTESRGTESVLNALSLAMTEPTSDSARRAIDLMMSEQRADGGWSWLDFSLAPWESKDAEVAGAAFAAIALAKVGGSSHEAGIERLRGFFDARKREGLHLHNKLMVLWSARSLDGILSAEEAAQFAESVRAVQRADGGFSLADLGDWKRKDGSPNVARVSDGYATAFAAYVLAGQGGDANLEVADRARRWLREHQADDGSWPGSSMNDDDAFNRGLMSDAATAFALLALR